MLSFEGLDFDAPRPEGFSAEAWEVVKRKPQARMVDVTAGNRHIYSDNKLRNDVIFIDKETNLKIPPDLICEWRNLPNHFPPDYFYCAIFDPNFYTRTGTPAPKWYQVHHGDPQERDGSWWGQPFITTNEMRRQLLEAQRAIAHITPRLCLKWTDSQHPVDKILTLFIEWKTTLNIYPMETGSFKRNTTGRTYWVKLVRRGASELR